MRAILPGREAFDSSFSVVFGDCNAQRRRMSIRARE